MMTFNEDLNKDAKLWEDYLLSWTDSQQALLRLFHGLSDRVEFMRDQFAENRHHPILWDMMMILPAEELVQLLDIIIAYAAHPEWGFADNVSNVVRRIPEPWISEKMWELTLPFLDEDHPDADSRIWGLLAFYSEIDLKLTAKLARYAVSTNNQDMVEAGEAWLARLANDTPII